LNYCIGLAFAAYAPAADFEGQTVATGLKGGYQVIAVDVNGDRKTDLIGLASGQPDLVWYENPSWQPHVLARGVNRMINLAARDVDGDGIPEIVLASDFANEPKGSRGTVSVLTHTGDPRQPWRLREIDQLTTSHRLRWADVEGNGRPVAVNAPLAGARAAAPEYRDHVPLVFYRPGTWTRETIGSENEGVTHGIFVADWNGDRRDDILTASFSGLHVYSLGKGGAWKRIEIAKGAPAAWPKSGASDLAVGRLGRARYVTAIEPWHGNMVTVYEKQGKEWRRQVIDEAIDQGHTIHTADLDGDGRDEVITGWRAGGGGVAVYRKPKKGPWLREVLEQKTMAASGCAVADLDGDARPDIACIGSATQNLRVYWNRSARRGR